MSGTVALGYFASAVFLVRLLPQPIRLARDGRPAGVSALAALNAVVSAFAWTAYGLIAGLQFLAAMSDSGRKASDLVAQFEPVPQMLKNVRYAQGADPLSVEAVKAEIARAEARLDGSGRVLIRKSGTEPLIRVMAEAEDEAVLREVVDGIVAAVEKAA
jgi:phosphoglucosamine mutase